MSKVRKIWTKKSKMRKIQILMGLKRVKRENSKRLRLFFQIDNKLPI